MELAPSRDLVGFFQTGRPPAQSRREQRGRGARRIARRRRRGRMAAAPRTRCLRQPRQPRLRLGAVSESCPKGPAPSREGWKRSGLRAQRRPALRPSLSGRLGCARLPDRPREAARAALRRTGGLWRARIRGRRGREEGVRFDPPQQTPCHVRDVTGSREIFVPLLCL